ncbi:sigma-54-dependent transcriptional regulator [Desulfovibrio cuneatus]|uniref:sigma-54-dependent transcriptional regulator n=1 Tax=Desulfovibrio cuneatus TaxID=159728 RepID=UPI0004247B2C|nr:sigma-54 dependent transcriptional regulator [Desulfovibrio cuneatus]
MKLLVIDDELLVRVLAQEAGSALGHTVVGAETLHKGLALAREGVDMVLLDAFLPDGNGLEHVATLRNLPARPEVLVITGYSDGEAVEKALYGGAVEFLTKPLSLPVLKQRIAQLAAFREAKADKSTLAPLRRSGILGNSPTLESALQLLAEAAGSNVNVLLLGETGVGKDLFAQALHSNSPQAGGPFITVDCAALPPTLVESQLFGHAKGAFTSADRKYNGLLSQAHEGTLFLDEVGELPLPMQASFLRVLETRRFRPVGETKEVESNFRLVCATNKELEKQAHMGLFRTDLLFRLQGVTVRIPALRDRVGDIPELAQFAVARFCLQHGMEEKHITPECMDALTHYSWPGNVRELFHTLGQACLAAGRQERLFVGNLPAEMRVTLTRQRLREAVVPVLADLSLPEESLPSLREWKAQAESQYLKTLLHRYKNDMRKAAAVAGVSRGHLYELLKKEI